MNKIPRSFCLSKHHHDSIAEATYCNTLLSKKQSGEIKDFKVWASVRLESLRKDWKIDFLVIENDGEEVYEECKGWCFSDDNFRNKLRAFMVEFPDRKIRVNHKLVKFTPKGRLKMDRYKRPKQKAKYHKTYNRETKRWDTVKI